jgi:uncharacterized protein
MGKNPLIHDRPPIDDLPRTVLDSIISFGCFLRTNGFEVSIPSINDALHGILKVGVENSDDFRSVLRAALVKKKDQLKNFENLFQHFWLAQTLEDIACTETGIDGKDHDGTNEDFGAPQSVNLGEAVSTDGEERENLSSKPHVMYSSVEVLKRMDFSSVPMERSEEVIRLIREIRSSTPTGNSRRRVSASGRRFINLRRLLRRNIQYGGEILEAPLSRRKKKKKKLVFLFDVSGSMNFYLYFILSFIREIRYLDAKSEIFTFSTHLHRITPWLTGRTFADALSEIAEKVRDWSGGTRIGVCLREFGLYREGRLLNSSTIVMVFSDGWDRGDPGLLKKEMERIQRRAYRVIWINPLMGDPEYLPICRGMKSALPFVDFFLPGHNVGSMERIYQLVGDLL